MTQNREAAPLFTTVPSEDAGVLGVFNLFINHNKFNLAIDYVPNWSGRIAGIIKGSPEDIKAAFELLENNESVGCRDLVESIKFVRAKIFQEKQRHAEQHAWSKSRGPK